MTLPFERTRALLYAGEFLAELLDPVKTPGVPDSFRGRARQAQRHYPSRYEILVIAKQAANGALAHPMFDAPMLDVPFARTDPAIQGWICADCAKQLLGPALVLSHTYHNGQCNTCQRERAVTSSDDFGPRRV